MGGKRKKNNRGGASSPGRPNDRNKRPNVWGPSTIPTDHPQGSAEWAATVAQNASFENYYKKMGIVATDEEWKEFMTAMARPLPTTFRINTSISPVLRTVVLNQLETIIKALPEKVEVDGMSISPPRELPWYPGGLGWHSALPKRAFRKNPVLTDFHQFLVYNDEQGNLTRQEAVSMIPPLFLDVQPHHVVVDMCAAPGSKTTQIIEAIHADRAADHNLPTGLVLANDVDTSRCYMLVHQTARLGSPAVTITNHEAQHFPLLSLETPGSTVRTPLLMDRVLADVPCSGDGTLRKNPDLWKRWNVTGGSGLHRLQLQIGYRAANLLKVGGRMVYSTCSLNPIENEAVIAELINRCAGALRVADVRHMHPSLIRAPGITSWPVIDKEGNTYTTWDEVPAALKPKIPQSFFPPTPEVAASIGLNLCMRVYPHFQDTGGFFITVLEKVAELKDQMGRRLTNWNNANAAAAEAGTDAPATDAPVADVPADNMSVELKPEDINSPVLDLPVAVEGEEKEAEKDEKTEEKKKKNPYVKFFEEPFLPLPEAAKKEFEQVKQFYGLNAEFPEQQLLSRSSNAPKMYLASTPMMEIIQGDKGGRLKVINAGLKAFQKHDGVGDQACSYRISQDAVTWIEPFMTKRVLSMTHDELTIIIRETEPMFTEFSKDTENALTTLEQGCFLIKIQQNSNAQTSGMVFAVWRGKKSIHLLVQKKEIQSLANILKITISKPKSDHISPGLVKNNSTITDATTASTTSEETTTTTTTTTNTTNPQ
eukprot:gene11949-13925_t